MFCVIIDSAQSSLLSPGIEPDLTREGGSIPVTLTLQEATEKDVLLLPMGACDDGAHSEVNTTFS